VETSPSCHRPISQPGLHEDQNLIRYLQTARMESRQDVHLVRLGEVGIADVVVHSVAVFVRNHEHHLKRLESRPPSLTEAPLKTSTLSVFRKLLLEP
jgi:hypothetical protein